MTPERWNQVKDLMDAALGVAPRERAAFVLERSGGDEELRHEVLSLLESYDDAGNFLESPAVDAEDFVQPAKLPADLAGTRVGAYELVGEIGRGGMGTVYLAVRADDELRQRVAVKLIRRDMESGFAIDRFRNERQILARLEHPNIARLIDGGTTAGGSPYLVMEYVEGEPLLPYCQSRSLRLPNRIAIFQKVCSAVHYAHRRMIVHRDLKPGNILVKRDGTPKLLDFGVAKILDPQGGDSGAEATLAGFRLITPAYASPEQIRGEPASVRSDIYSLGLVLWDLITGRAPRHDDGTRSFDLPDSGSHDTASRLVRNLHRVVLKATRDKPAERYDSVDAMSSDLQKALAGGEIAFPEEPASGPEAPEGSIAVLPFQFLGTDTSENYLGLGIADAVITRLSNIGRIAVRPTGTVMRYSAGCDAGQAGRELNVQYVLEGRVQKLQSRVRVTVQLVEVRTQTPVWAAGFDEQLPDLLRMEDSISAQVAQALVPQMTGEEQEDIARSGTTSAKAHEAYLRGRWYWNQHTEEALPHALVLFTEAVAEDPNYPHAHAGIADYHIALGMRGLLPPVEAFAAAMQSAETAIALDPKLAEAHASLGLAIWARDGNFETAIHHLQLAIALNPEHAVAHDWFGLMNAARGRPIIAMASIERARRLDPESAMFLADLAMCHYNARDFGQVRACLTRPGGDTPQPPPLINGAVLPLTLIAEGEPARALEAARTYLEITGRTSWAMAVLARAEDAAGNAARALSLLAELERRAEDYYVSGTALALANLACGRKQEAIRQLERGCRDREWWTMYLPLMAVWDELRGLHRFERLLKPLPAARPVPKAVLWLAAAILTTVVVLSIYAHFRPTAPPFQNARISRLTTNGMAERAAISADGRRVAYTVRTGGKVSVRIRDLETASDYAVAGAWDGPVPSLEFTGADVAFMVMPVNEPHGGVLYLVRAAGGSPAAVLSGLSNPVSVLPDGASIAYYSVDPGTGTGRLVVNEVGRERVVASRAPPEAFADSPGPLWSPDGRKMACAVAGPSQWGYGIRVEAVDRDGSVSSASRFVWQNILAIAWLKDSKALLVAGQDRDSPFQQIWYLPPGGAPARITNDLNDYIAVGVTAGESALVAVQAQTIANLYVQRAGNPTAVQITPGASRYSDVAWMPGGGILYASDATGSAGIWRMDADGGNARQLTNGPGGSWAPAVSPDGRTIAFHSNRGGAWRIWKMDADGANPAPVSSDPGNSRFPQFTPDGAGVVYQHAGRDGLHTAWKAPLAGGAPVQLTTALSMYPTVAADGRLAFWYAENRTAPTWKIGVTEAGDAAPLIQFGFPSGRMPNVPLRWAPRMDAIGYIETRDGVSNIWVQPIAGGAPRQVTSWTSGTIYSFDWSRDGSLLYSRGLTTRDVVLMRRTAR